jgi:hypothetical protein
MPAPPHRTALEQQERLMFRELMNFSYRRTPLQALGWYLIFFLIAFVIGFVFGAVAGFFSETDQEVAQIGFAVGQRATIAYHIILGILLLWNRPKNAANILLAFAGVVLSMLLSALGGLIPLAVLTTRPPVFKSASTARS